MLSCCLGFIHSGFDFNIYVYHSGPHYVILALCMDDCVFFSNFFPLWTSLKQIIMKGCAMTDLGEVNHFLQLEVIRNHANDEVSLSQEYYSKEN